jgi:hypothetical protein
MSYDIQVIYQNLYLVSYPYRTMYSHVISTVMILFSAMKFRPGNSPTPSDGSRIVGTQQLDSLVRSLLAVIGVPIPTTNCHPLRHSFQTAYEPKAELNTMKPPASPLLKAKGPVFRLILQVYGRYRRVSNVLWLSFTSHAKKCGVLAFPEGPVHQNSSPIGRNDM